MTTIAYKDGVLAADTLATWGNSRDGYFGKIARRGPYLAAVSGGMPAAQAFLDWFRRGCVGDAPQIPESPDNAKAFCVIITPDDIVLTHTPWGWERTRNVDLAMGSGANYAQGAMAAGASPEEAVRIACLYDTHSGGEIEVLRR